MTDLQEKLEFNRCVSNIVACYNSATRQEKRDGLAWYRKARRDCLDVANDYNMRLRHVVGVVAATSPNLKWEKNVHTATQVIDGFNAGIPHDEIDGCMAYKANRLKGYQVLASSNRSAVIAKVLNGPKVSAFYDNIMGGDSVTIDGHARNIAYNERVNLKDNKINMGKREYTMLEKAYRQAAWVISTQASPQGYKLKACDLQAITWCAWRRQQGIK